MSELLAGEPEASQLRRGRVTSDDDLLEALATHGHHPPSEGKAVTRPDAGGVPLSDATGGLSTMRVGPTDGRPAASTTISNDMLSGRAPG